MVRNLYLVVSFLIFSCFSSHAQNDEQRLVTKANEKYNEYSFTPAIDIYKKILDRGYVSADLLKKLGNSYYFNADYIEAANTYKRLADNYEAEVGPEYYFRYAQSLKSINDYEGSNAVMSKFLEATSDDVRASSYNDDRDYLAEIKRNSGRFNVAPFQYNSPYSDFAPTFYKEGLIFSSDRDTGNFARYRHTWNSRDFLDLYKVDADSLSNGSVLKLDDQVNTRLHESTSATTKDGSTIYFTRNNFKSGKYIKDESGIIRLKVFRATMTDEGIWGNIEELPFNSDDYSVAHPALSPDGKILYFASDMPGSLGESDIFRTMVNEDGTFSVPENLGATVNTEVRETFPFISDKDVLYFSSDGHPGLGGLDVFATKISDGRIDGKVMNVGEPINGNVDDFTFIIDENTRKGYFASNRSEGQGGDDIYAFLETKALLLDCEKQISGTVRDKASNAALVGATVKVLDDNNEEIMSEITDSEGNYTLSLNCNEDNFVRAMTEGYVTSEKYIGKSDGEPQVVDFYLERSTIIAGFGDDLAQLLQLSTIYFDFDKYNIRKDSEVEVEKIVAAMEKYPSLRIKINSHTDSRGKDSYNLWLSQKRAESTLNYIVKRGINKERLSSEGYGETKLINRCANGVKCSDKEHELNRRSEFIIME